MLLWLDRINSQKNMNGQFHLAFATGNLERAKAFYGDFLSCTEGRKGPSWVDYNFFGHQLTIQFVSSKNSQYANFHHPKSGFPLNHWGIILHSHDWNMLRDKLIHEETNFVVEPQLFLEDETGEQRIMMLRDPDGNILEFKTFTIPEDVFNG